VGRKARARARARAKFLFSALSRINRRKIQPFTAEVEEVS